MDSSEDSNKNFFKHVFNFDDDSKKDILNIIQYALIAIIPVVILNKIIGRYAPDAEDKKGSLEITAEIVIQILVIFIGLYIIQRIVTFIPTYSGTKYPEHSILYSILSILMITISLQTKIGEKVNILVSRIIELWEGKNDKNNQNKKNNIKVSQPISGQMNDSQINMQSMNNSPYINGTSINSLPVNDDVSMQPQQLPNYNAMYKKDNTPLVDAATPGISQETFGPVAASEFLGGGGGSFGSSW